MQAFHVRVNGRLFRITPLESFPAGTSSQRSSHRPSSRRARPGTPSRSSRTRRSGTLSAPLTTTRPATKAAGFPWEASPSPKTSP